MCVRERERERERERGRESPHAHTREELCVCESTLECIAGGHFDRCGTCAAQLCAEEGRLGWGEERNIAELQKERRLRSQVCKWGLGEGNSIKRVRKTHIMPAAVFAKVSY